jgi:hypothetical protein
LSFTRRLSILTSVKVLHEHLIEELHRFFSDLTFNLFVDVLSVPGLLLAGELLVSTSAECPKIVLTLLLNALDNIRVHNSSTESALIMLTVQELQFVEKLLFFQEVHLLFVLNVVVPFGALFTLFDMNVPAVSLDLV